MQQTSQTSPPNYFGDLRDLPETESTTLSIGQECLDFFAGDEKKAIEKFHDHKTEIVLTHLYKVLSAQTNPSSEVFELVLKLIIICDGA